MPSTMDAVMLVLRNKDAIFSTIQYCGRLEQLLCSLVLVLYRTILHPNPMQMSTLLKKLWLVM
jgi:hypothetical protein